MPIMFGCKCGQHLRAKDEQGGKQIQCPSCGRKLVIPRATATDEQQAAEWKIEATAAAVERAEKAGIIRRGRASVARLSSESALDRDVNVNGNVKCWHCRASMGFTGSVFGRPGFIGTLSSMNCSRCHAKVWIGYWSQASEDGTELLLFAPSHTRDYSHTESDALPAPAFTVEQVTQSPPVKNNWILTGLPNFMGVVTQRQPYQEVSAFAAKLVGQRLSPAQTEEVSEELRGLLEKEDSPYLSAILGEALACLRDTSTGPLVQEALLRALESEDPSDDTNLPFLDLCVLPLVFGEVDGFLEACNRGLKGVAAETRGYQFDKPVKPKEILDLLKDGETIHSFGSTLGGTSWQRVQPVVPLQTESEGFKKLQPQKGWFDRLLKKKK